MLNFGKSWVNEGIWEHGCQWKRENGGDRQKSISFLKWKKTTTKKQKIRRNKRRKRW